MNENEILDNLNIEDINVEIESEDLINNETEEVLETQSLPDELDLDIHEDEESEISEESLDELIDDLDELISENVQDTEEDVDIESEFPDNGLDEDIETTSEVETEIEEVIEPAEMDITNDSESIDETEEVSMLEKYILDEENAVEEISDDSIGDIDTNFEEETQEDETDILEETEEEIEEESLVLIEEEDNLEEEIISDLSDDENIITNDLTHIDIEFGIEAKGFILSLKMMEAMIEKGYIFKDILNDKVFDAVMIFNGNLENTVVTSDIKIKIEDGKIQLIKG